MSPQLCINNVQLGLVRAYYPQLLEASVNINEKKKPSKTLPFMHIGHTSRLRRGG